MYQENIPEVEQANATPDTPGVRLPDGSTYYNVDGNSLIEAGPEPSPW